jgi:hypothetical protein
MRQLRAVSLVVIVALATGPGSALGFDATKSFARGTTIVSLQAGGGGQEFSRGGETADVSFVNITPRLSIVPIDPFGPAWLLGTIETGIEGWLQRYIDPEDATAGGVKVVLRYHVLSLGRVVPYLEADAGAGGTDLEVLGHHSPFTFVLEGGAGLSVLLTETIALTGGYRFQHLSNAGLQKPNRSYDAHTGTLGVSFFFP